MNIAILHYSVPPIVGGVESVVAHHAYLMSAGGHSVRLIAARGKALSEDIPLVVIPLADSRHARVTEVKDQLDRGEVTADFETLRDELGEQLQSALIGVDVLIVHNICSLNKNLALNCRASSIAYCGQTSAFDPLASRSGMDNAALSKGIARRLSLELAKNRMA
ncbi:MAG: hypothetical protein IPL71_18725 [Anaerolineales bacterium]|uniref:hypothetical protein n=1 Tax=Candidatus Villigracilis proximus TaxID=3140683 RepID=UPI00313472CB|nr:hypothetical protein [Anaerolineales bacterium]